MAFAIGAGVTAVAFVVVTWTCPAQQPAAASIENVPTSHYDLLAMTPEQLAKVDVALMNLLCAKGLPSAENLEVPEMLTQIDEWAERIPPEIERHLYRASDPRYAELFQGSQNRVRIYLMVQVLQEDCGVRYNPARIYDPDLRDSQDTFIHGMLPGAGGGTCASMPVLYAAVGRRLGFPMKLAVAKEHLFCRWDDGKERFNIEGAGEGLAFHPDEFYRTWPKPLTDADMATGVFLTSMTPAEELAAFLHHRGMCLHQNGRLTEARAAFAEAHRLQPRDTNTFAALRVVCGASIPRPQYAQNPAAEAWLRGALLPDPDDPTPKIPMPGVNPAFGIPNQHQPVPLSGITKEARQWRNERSRPCWLRASHGWPWATLLQPTTVPAWVDS